MVTAVMLRFPWWRHHHLVAIDAMVQLEQLFPQRRKTHDLVQKKDVNIACALCCVPLTKVDKLCIQANVDSENVQRRKCANVQRR